MLRMFFETQCSLVFVVICELIYLRWMEIETSACFQIYTDDDNEQ